MNNPLDAGYFESAELRAFGFKHVGEGVRIAKNATVVGVENISIGNNVRIDAYVSIVATSGPLDMGSFIHIGGACHLSAAGGLTMEDFSGLSQGVRIYSATDDYTGRYLTNPTVPAAFTGARIAPVCLRRHVIVGSGSVILPGVTIGEGSSVGALTLVGKSLPDWGVYSGVPARRLKDRKRDLLEIEARFLASLG